MAEGNRRFEIDADITRAQTPPARFYRDAAWFDAVRTRVMPHAWHALTIPRNAPAPQHVLPFTLLAGCLDEELVLTRDGHGERRCVSNICTHRGMKLAREPGRADRLRCGYHGRTFKLDGAIEAAPGFEGAVGFPGRTDDLARVSVASWHGLTFVSLDPHVPFDAWIAPVAERMDWWGRGDWPVEPEVRDYDVAASWALYVDNFMEGFHVPFVHQGLVTSLDGELYRTVLSAHGNVQIGVGRRDTPCFELPAGHADEGTRVAAYWFWLYPCTMLNFYPWGLSLNAVQPLGVEQTRVRYATFVREPRLRDKGAGADVDRIEREDEAVVESVQRALRGRLYRRGRYAPRWEQGVHQFHRLVLAELDRSDE